MNKLSVSKISVTIALLLFQFPALAQDSLPKGFDHAMRSNGKIYVVMAVCLLILIVVLLYLVRIDLKLSSKEKKL